MIFPIIDISQFINTNFYSKEGLNNIAQEVLSLVVTKVYDKIQNLAAKNLKKTSKIYQDNLKMYVSGFTGLITLTDNFALDLEDGKQAFDMKQGFANSSKAKRSKENYKRYNKGKTIDWKEKGWYLTIPFRWGVPTSLGTEFSNVMENPIYKAALKLKPFIKGENENIIQIGEHLSIEQLKTIGDIYTKRLTHNVEFQGTNISYTHVAPIREGMIRTLKEYENTSQGTYVTFRRVSANSNKNSWIHKGLQAKHFFETALQSTDFETLVGLSIEKSLKKIENE